MVEGMSVVVNVMLSLMSVMRPQLPCTTHGGELMYFGCVCSRCEHGFLNCDDICMCVVNKLFEFLDFVFNSAYVDLQYDEIYFNFTALSVSLCCVCSHVVIFGLSVRLS